MSAPRDLVSHVWGMDDCSPVHVYLRRLLPPEPKCDTPEAMTVEQVNAECERLRGMLGRLGHIAAAVSSPCRLGRVSIAIYPHGLGAVQRQFFWGQTWAEVFGKAREWVEGEVRS